jgi:hypothetical protein
MLDNARFFNIAVVQIENAQMRHISACGQQHIAGAGQRLMEQSASHTCNKEEQRGWQPLTG